MNVKVKGYLLGALAAASYGMNPLFALPLYSAGMNVDSVLFYRYSLAIPILAVMIKARGRDFRLKKNENGRQICWRITEKQARKCRRISEKNGVRRCE